MQTRVGSWGLVYCSVFNNFEQGALHFHFALDLANYVAGPGEKALSHCLSMKGKGSALARGGLQF